MKPTQSVSAVLVRPLVHALSASPAALEAFFGATDLTPELLADGDARVSPAQFCVAWAEALRLSGDPGLALRLAAAIPPGAFGVVEYLCRAAPTVGVALRQWTRFLNLLDDAVVVGLVTEGSRTHLRVLVESEAPAPASHELCFAMLCVVVRRSVAGPWNPLAVEFTHRPLGPAATYAAFFGVSVTFGAPHTQLVLSQEALHTPLVGADPGLLAVLTRHAESLTHQERSPPLTTEVRRVLREALQSDDAQVNPVARRLGLTARTLQRRLEDEGTTFQALREATRRDLAGRYLEQDLSLTEIAYLLGFSEPSAFFRAFKRWTGQTPLEVRNSRRGTLALA